MIAELKGVKRTFGTHVALEDVSLRIDAGELLGIVGPNGGGKSTLLMILAGLVRATSGSVKVDGNVGLVTARPGLYPLLTGRENLHHFGVLLGLTEKDIDSRAEALASTLALTTLDAPVSTLSTGMQQKLSLIRALLSSPKLLLLDEPTANLDPISAHALHVEVRRRADTGQACVLVTHDLTSAEAICDRVLLVDRTIRRELKFKEHRAPLQGPTLKAWQETLR